MKELLTVFLLVFAQNLLSLLGNTLHAQDTVNFNLDTGKIDYVARMEEFFRRASAESASDLALDRAMIRQGRIFEEIKVVSRQARSFLKKGFDTLSMHNRLTEVSRWRDLAGDGVFQHQGSAHTSRNLTATYNILHALQIQILTYKNQIDNYHEHLVNYRLQIDSLSNDRSLFVFSRDSVELTEYINKIRLVSKGLSPIDKDLAANINGIQAMQDKVNLELLTIENNLEEIVYYQTEITNKGLSRDFAPLWERSKYERPPHEILYFSFLKAKLVFTYYVKANKGKLFLAFVILVCIVVYVTSLKREAVLIKDKLKGESLMLSSPICSSLLIGLSVTQFMFPDPPYVFLIIFLLVSSLLLTFIFRRYISTYWMLIWLSFSLLFLAASIDNMILQASRTERYVMLGISILAVICGTIALLNKNKHNELQERWILYPILLMTILETMAIILNIFGIFNIAKALMVAGLISVSAAIIFLWVVKLVNEGLSIASTLYIKQERRFFYINYNRVGMRAPAFFYMLLTIGWLVLFGRNFYEFHFITEPINELLYSEHRLGSYNFSVINIGTFFVIMIAATVLSKVVSFFASDPQWNTNDEKEAKKFHIGSWILLVRISIIVLGLFLAFSAIGIPLQQITIIIGALGVGIGFGLQSLVNNLVSGLIIAFEKPVNVDDMIEVGGQSGRVKSIGFRSSVIATPDGANMIMPNGDLLNSHVINWTLGGFRKRLHIHLDLRYGIELERTKELLLKIFENETQVLDNPSPTIEFVELTAQSVSVDVHFWVRTLKDAGQIKSNLLVQITRMFDKNGVQLALTQHEVHIHQDNSDSEKQKL